MLKNLIVKNIPNALTISRILSCIAGATAFVLGNVSLAALLYIYGAVSDFFDGLTARKLNAFSEFGRKLDAFSDKLYAGSLLIPSILCGNLLMLVPLILELNISFIILKSEKLGFKPATVRVGKFKTALLFPTMIVGLLSTLSMDMYLLLCTLLPITTILQVNSMITYDNLLKCNMAKAKSEQQIEEIKEVDLEIDKTVSKSETVNKGTRSNKYVYNKVKDMADELAFYITTPCNKQDFGNKAEKARVKSKKRLK